MKSYLRKKRQQVFPEQEPPKKLIDLSEFSNEISHCADCKANPAVFLTDKRISVCQKHWNILAEAPVEWSEDGNFMVVTN